MEPVESEFSLFLFIFNGRVSARDPPRSQRRVGSSGLPRSRQQCRYLYRFPDKGHLLVCPPGCSPLFPSFQPIPILSLGCSCLAIERTTCCRSSTSSFLSLKGFNFGSFQAPQALSFTVESYAPGQHSSCTRKNSFYAVYEDWLLCR